MASFDVNKEGEPINFTHLDHLPEHLHARTDFDVVVAKGGILLPCYSQVLMVKSRVIAGMFEATDKEGWGAGVADALADASLGDAQRFLAVCHHHEGTAAFLGGMECDELEGLVRIADKLDVPQILEECEMYLVASGKYLEAPVRWLGVAGHAGLADVARRCRTALLAGLVGNANREDISTRGTYAGTAWESIPAEEYERLLNGVLRAHHRAIKPLTERAHTHGGLRSDQDWKEIVEKIRPFE